MIAARPHTSREYEDELRTIRERVLRMGGRVEAMIADGVRAFSDRDAFLARRVLDIDSVVDKDEQDIDEAVIRVLARRQPMARDLRFLLVTLKMVGDLERIGDLACHVAERALRLEGVGPLPLPEDDVLQLAASVQAMLRRSIDALADNDAGSARAAIAADDEVDELYHRLYRAVLAEMTRDSSVLEGGLHLQYVAKSLERMGDHATNVAEHVVFLVEGVNVRHRKNGG